MEVPELYDISIEQLEVWEEANVRKREVLLNIEDLAGNIKKFGVQSPLLVWEKKKNEKYMIFSGQRRYEASKLADLDTIPCLVYKTMTVTQAKVLSFSENMYREDMTMEDKSNATRELFEKFKDMDKVAKEGLAVLLGYSSIAGMGRIDMKKLKEMKLLSSNKGKYKADLSLLGLSKN